MMSKPTMKYGGCIALLVCQHADLDGLARHWSQGPQMDVYDWEREGDRAWMFFEWTGKGGHPADMRRRVYGQDPASTTVRPAVAAFGVTAYVCTDAEHWEVEEDGSRDRIDWARLAG